MKKYTIRKERRLIYKAIGEFCMGLVMFGTITSWYWIGALLG